MHKTLTTIMAGATALASVALLQPAAAEPVRHVLLISVDGLHSVDLERYVAANPQSVLASLGRHAVTYSNAAASFPSDSFPGLLALVTGGTPRSTGVYYDDTYDRKLAKPGHCDQIGTEIDFTEDMDLDDKALDTRIDVKKLPLDPAHGCAAVWPHSYLRVNTLFELVHAAGGHTAWSDKHPVYDLVNGPSGKGVVDLYNPEINANGITDSVDKTIEYDDMKVRAVLAEIRGRDHADAAKAPVPALFGMNFQAVSVGQKLAGNGYQDALAVPSAGLAKAMAFVDTALGRMVAALKEQHLYDSTLLVVTAKHGQSPIDPARRRIIDSKLIKATVDSAGSGLTAQVTNDSVALIWLTDSKRTPEAVAALAGKEEALGIAKIYAGAELAAMFGDPARDSRVPDIILQPEAGVIYTKPTATKLAEHGGTSPDDRSVALLLAHPALGAARVSTPVSTLQVAPTIARTLGLDPRKLDAVRMEHTQPLPGFGIPAGRVTAASATVR